MVMPPKAIARMAASFFGMLRWGHFAAKSRGQVLFSLCGLLFPKTRDALVAF